VGIISVSRAHSLSLSLDCSIGATRIKARATSEDLDKDGYLDASMHEINYFDGVSRLHVMNFMTPYSANLTRDMSHWIEANNAVSDVLNPRITSSIIR
jgi:hypothetical protein